MFKQLTIFALGIMPYITASIILQLLTVVVRPRKALERRRNRPPQDHPVDPLSDGHPGPVPVSRHRGTLQNSRAGFVINPGFGFMIMTMITLTTGTAFIMWLGEQITERGIGNGMSLIIFTGIVIGLPKAMNEIYLNVFELHKWPVWQMILILSVMIAVVAFIVLVERGERRIPVQYAKRVVGRRMMGGQSTHLPLKVTPAA